MKQVSDRKFGLLMGGVFLLTGLYAEWGRHQFLPLLFMVSAFLLSAALIFPVVLWPLNKAWHYLGDLLGKINSYILLTLVYFLILTPISFFMRLAGKRPLTLKPDKNSISYWQKVTDQGEEGMKRQF